MGAGMVVVVVVVMFAFVVVVVDVSREIVVAALSCVVVTGFILRFRAINSVRLRAISLGNV